MCVYVYANMHILHSCTAVGSWCTELFQSYVK